MLLGGPAKSSRRKALCRAARLKGAPLGPGKRSRDWLHMERFAVEPPLVRPSQALSPGMPEAQGDSEAWFLDCRVPQKHFAVLDFEAVFRPFSRSSF